MTTALALIAISVMVAFLVLYFVFPNRLVAVALSAVRRSCGFGSRSIEVSGDPWHYLEGGPASAETLVLLHGFGGDKDNWPLYARALNRDYRVIIPDLPGFGQSIRRPDADYRIRAQTARLQAFIRAMGIDRFHIAGNSMGGCLALDYALIYPRQVRTVALLNNAGVHGRTKSELELAVERGESPLTVATADEFEKLLTFVAHKPFRLPGIVKRVYCEDAITHRRFLDRVFESLFEELQLRPWTDELERLTAPTLIIWGRHDRLIDVSCTEVMQARIPNNHCVVFEDVGHVPMLECPTEAAAVHLEHLIKNRAA